MDHEKLQLLKFIKMVGYRTLEEIQDEFQTDEEMIDIRLDSLTGDRIVKKVRFDSNPGVGTLYYVENK